MDRCLASVEDLEIIVYFLQSQEIRDVLSKMDRSTVSLLMFGHPGLVYIGISCHDTRLGFLKKSIFHVANVNFPLS